MVRNSYIVIMVLLFILGVYVGYDGASGKDNQDLIKHTELLTNIIAQQLQYEKSIATCKTSTSPY